MGRLGLESSYTCVASFLPSSAPYEPVKATTRVPSVAYGLGVIKRPSGACSALPRGRFVRGVLVRGEGSQTHPRIADYTVLCTLGARVGELPYISNGTFSGVGG